MKTRIFKHYKGGRYLVLINDAIESTNGREGRRVVVYFSCQKETWHTREYKEFVEFVEVSGVLVPRFEEVL